MSRRQQQAEEHDLTVLRYEAQRIQNIQDI